MKNERNCCGQLAWKAIFDKQKGDQLFFW